MSKGTAGVFFLQNIATSASGSLEKIVLDLSMQKFLGQSRPSVGEWQKIKHEKLTENDISIILKIKLTYHICKSRNTESNFLGSSLGTSATEVEV